MCVSECVCVSVFSRILNNKAAKTRPSSYVTREEEEEGGGKGGGGRGGRMIGTIEQS